VENGLEAMNVETPDILKTSKAYAYLNTAADNLMPFVKNLFKNLG
jgi:hypothetical protein